MPGSLLASFIGWLATHLVALSLLVFLAVGLVLSGRLALPDVLSGLNNTATQPVSDSRPVVAKPPQMPRLSPADASTPVFAQPKARQELNAKSRAAPSEPVTPSVSPPRRPRLIGGSIPVYPDYDVSGRLSGADRTGFRPSEAIPAPVPTRDELIQRARRAFWNGDFETAERLYFDMLEGASDDPELFGELGNLYLAMGRQELALDAYFEAGLRLRVLGEQDRLNRVIQLLSDKGDQRALELAP